MWANRLLPDLYYQHRGYFLVALGIFQLHLISALDHLLPGAEYRHAGLGWSVVDMLATEIAWGLVHALCGFLILLGLYQDLIWARFAFAASISTYAVLGASWLYPGVVHFGEASASSFLGAGIAFMACLCSLAATIEPPRNPDSERYR